MARKRIEIPTRTARIITARSGGYCANSSCHEDLFPSLPSGRVATIAQLAHIIGQSPKGPRGDHELPLSVRNDPDNIILLCPNCHAKVDDVNATEEFPVELLRRWKSEHERRVRHGAGIKVFDDRASLNAAVGALLRHNSGVWRAFGPESKRAQENPYDDAAAELWRDRVRDVIIPNNRRILEFVDANARLFKGPELELVEDFRQHAAILDLNYSAGRRYSAAPQFPREFEQLFP